MKQILCLVLLLASPFSSSDGDIAPKGGILISVQRDGERSLSVDPIPLQLNLRTVSSSLESRANAASGPMSAALVKEQIEKMPLGTVYLYVRGSGGNVRGVVPMREIRSFGSHSKYEPSQKISLGEERRYWANPRINLEGATVSVKQKTPSENKMLGSIQASLK